MNKDNVQEHPVAETPVQKADGKKKTFGAMIGDVITFFIVCIAIYCVTGFVGQMRTGEIFFPFGYRAVRILSGSMEDEIHTGALVLVKKTKDVAKNDIIFFITEDGSPVVHRHIGNNEDGTIKTKGDANPIKDLEPVTQDRLQGKVVLIINSIANVEARFRSLAGK